jgi:hypothetical protein
MLCNLKRKNQIKAEIVRIRKQVAEAREKERDMIDSRAVPNTRKLESEDAAVQREIDNLQAELADLEGNPDRKVSVNDVMEITRTLQQPITKKDAQDIIWEVSSILDTVLFAFFMFSPIRSTMI